MRVWLGMAVRLAGVEGAYSSSVTTIMMNLIATEILGITMTEGLTWLLQR